MTPNPGWEQVQRNRTYWPRALSEDEGRSVKWHSPAAPQSSQVFCISAFGGLRCLPDGANLLGRLIAAAFPNLEVMESWRMEFEYTDPPLLGETGNGTPTNVDVFLTSDRAVVCVESKLLLDALGGFGGCAQTRRDRRHCAGFYGPGSDLKTGTDSRCRLEAKDGRRAPRLYWRLGRRFFSSEVFCPQHDGEVCPLAGPNYQLMRNFLFAASAAGDSRGFRVLAIVPETTAATVLRQVAEFKETILLDRFRDTLNAITYESLTNLLLLSPFEESRRLGRFLEERIDTLCRQIPSRRA